MKLLKTVFILFTTVLWMGCEKDALYPIDPIQKANVEIETKVKIKSLKATGEIDVEYYNKSGDETLSEMKYATVAFNAHEAAKKNSAKGDITIMMTKPNGMISREIKAEVFAVMVDPETTEARFLALVTSDVKNDDSEHNDGDHEDGDHEDGDHEDGDSSGSDHDDSEHEGGSDSGHNNDGRNSRIGQTIAVKVFDGGTPGVNGDSIHWKWYGPNHQQLPDIQDNTGWEKDGQKNIVAGNLVVHIK